MGKRRLVIYCIVPEPLAATVPELRAHLAGDDRVQVIVDRRKRDRRAGAREGRPARSAAEDRDDRRSVSDRRRPVLPRMSDLLPPDLAERAEGIRFVQRMLPVSGGFSGLEVEDVVQRVREGDPEAPTELYWRVYERVHSRLCVLLGDADSADVAAPVAFGRILDALENEPDGERGFDALLYDAVDAGFAAQPLTVVEGGGPAYAGTTLAVTDPMLDEMLVIQERDPRWFSRGLTERDRILREAGTHVVAAEHIGSTGVPAIAARPIIDLLVGVKRMQEPAGLRKELVGSGYERCGNAGTKGRALYRKRGVLGYDVHVVEYDGPLWRDAIALREFLRRNPTEAAKWAAAKRAAARTGKHSLLRYTDARAGMLSNLQARALQSSQRAA